MTDVRREPHTTVCCAHPYFGFVCTPHAIIDFSDRVPAEFGHGAVATIDSRGFRNRDVPETKPHDEFWVGLFGSSVAFGVPASDNDGTIAAALERALAGRRRDGKRARVINFAIPGGQQPQQFLVLALHRHLLDGAVTFDGVSELIVPACYNHGHMPSHFPYRPYYEQLYGAGRGDEQICESVQAERKVAAFRRRPTWQQRLLSPFHARDMARRRARLEFLSEGEPAFQSMFSGGRSASAVQAAEAGAVNWADYTALMHDVCRAQAIQALFVVHPVPERGKPLTELERGHLRLQAEMLSLRASGYDRVLALAKKLHVEGRPVVSFADVFSGCSQSVYTDITHFEDRGSAIVAERMAEWICRTWTGFRP